MSHEQKQILMSLLFLASLRDVVPGDMGYSIDDFVMHIRANLHCYDGDDSQALLFDLTELVREYLGFQTVEEY